MRFKAGDLMEGWTPKEQLGGIKAVQDCLAELYGDDKAMQVCILSFLLGNTAAKTEITAEMAVAMTVNAYDLTKAMEDE